jgi:hypothetical protein
MRTSQMTRVMRLAATTLLAVAVGTVRAQDAPKQIEGAAEGTTKEVQGRTVAPRGYLTTLSVFSLGSPKPSRPVSDAASDKHESPPASGAAGGSATPPRPCAANGSLTDGAANGSIQPLSWWKRYKVGLWPCLGYESEFEPAPFGASVYTVYRHHVANGDAARMVLYHYDFVNNTATLNTHGQDQVAKIAAMLAQNVFPVIVERTPSNPQLAEARRLAVLKQLGRGGIPIAAERVVIGAPIANGLRGAEAEIIYQNLLSQTRERGLVTGAASGLLGATTTPSAGGGAGVGTGAPPTPR